MQMLQKEQCHNVLVVAITPRDANGALTWRGLAVMCAFSVSGASILSCQRAVQGWCTI